MKLSRVNLRVCGSKLSANRVRLALGTLGIASVAATVWLGFWGTPPSANMGQRVRLLYIHPAVAWVAYLAFGVAAVASVLYLWGRTRSLAWDRLAVASAEVGVVFCGLTLVSGSIWGRATWGVWWAWDARLDSTALLFVCYVGYLVLRRVPADRAVRARRCALAALVSFVLVPVSYLSVYWFNSLHQTGTVLDPQRQIKVNGIMLLTMLLGFCALTVVYAWMVMHRYQVEVLEERLEDEALDLALAAETRRVGVQTVGAQVTVTQTAGPQHVVVEVAPAQDVASGEVVAR
ncbi:MAG: cytochrome c biogenesis protein [Acidimicrobiales bacterium]